MQPGPGLSMPLWVDLRPFSDLCKLIERLLAGRAVIQAVLPIASFAALGSIRVSLPSSRINREPDGEATELFHSITVASRACVLHRVISIVFAETGDSAIVGIADGLISNGAYRQSGCSSCRLRAIRLVMKVIAVGV